MALWAAAEGGHNGPHQTHRVIAIALKEGIERVPAKYQEAAGISLLVGLHACSLLRLLRRCP